MTPGSEGEDKDLRSRAHRLGLWGLLSSWSELEGESWVERLVVLEEETRRKRSLERRVNNARVGRFKPMADFDWQWPKEIDSDLIEEIFRFDFLKEAANVILVGPNGVGKTMIAKNLAHQAVLRGHTALFTTVSELLNDLAAQEVGSALSRRLRQYLRPALLVIDEVGYLASSSRHADLLFQVITHRYQERSVVLTTNKSFREWNEVFPSSACTVALIDRLIHKSEIVEIKAESYRVKEAKEREEARLKKRPRKKGGKKT
jgi:DNA replication protein DnaC